MTKRLTAAALAVLIVAAALASLGGTAGAKAKPMKKTVTMVDNYYSPSKLTITVGSTVTWKTPVDIGDSHDVKLTKKPSGAKFTFVSPSSGKKVTKTTFQSPPYASGPAKFAVTGFTKPGKYHMICTFHETEMQMDITVKK
jgi:plastocyanin